MNTDREIGYRYRFIQELEQPPSDYFSDDLMNLAAVWRERYDQLKSSNALQTFNKTLSREWAIETGIIENLYTLDRETTETLIEQGLKASLIPRGSSSREPQEVISMIHDQETTLESLFQFVKATRELSTSYIKALHQSITRSQKTVEAIDDLGRPGAVALERGTWKTRPNNPLRPDGRLHEYCPPIHVAAEMDRLIDMYAGYKRQRIAPEVLAAWLHHRFAQIHPFQDGNGRVARVLASLVFIQNGWFPLVITRDIRSNYISALENADRGELNDLVRLFSGNQKRSFRRALSLSDQVEEQATSIIIDAAIQKIRERRDVRQKAQRTVFDFGDSAANDILQKLQSLCDELSSKLADIDGAYAIFAEKSTPEHEYWFYRQIVSVAKGLEYFADTRTYHRWVRLQIREGKERRTDIIFSVHSLGTTFSGVLAVSSFIEFREQSEDSGGIVSDMHTVCDDIFQMSYKSEYASVTTRLNTWCDRSIVVALEEWRRQA